MFKKYLEMITNMFKKTEGEDNKKKTENIVVFLIIVVITIIAINFILKDNQKSSNNLEDNNIQSNKGTTMVDSGSSDDLEKKLESILSKINGVDNVSVLVTYSSSQESVPMYDVKQSDTITQEKDSSGGERTTTQNDTQKTVVYKEQSGAKEPIVQTTIIPKISGVMIVASGVSDSKIKSDISTAVEAVTGVGSHKIQILERKKL